ncbi:ABC transporter transmembrane domain-containing protein [Alteromonas halophila]|uniref:ABC transporter ATP-binding protein n=1 Tax=Alteromonas halophila TaxID=516698 RepID=A0A918JHQ3_9ALTE|nr:ABC transporter ATP-binding protein [Alteromonas halophila]GGW82182.1 ABC transporter ATP-binding protein [Alteromonas halophila]
MGKSIDLARTRKLLFGLLKPERGFFGVAIAYGLAVGLMTLAVPIAVQTLINTIANIASVRAVTILAVVLFFVLAVSGVFSALRMRVMELYERRVYARLTADLSLKTIMAPHSFFEGRQNTSITQRYFDIMTLQKNVPALMVDGFALVLQMLVGFTLVSFYHPALFVFNVLILVVMYLIWEIWGTGAKRTAVQLSHAKYETAKWLGDIASAHEFFKSSRHLDYAGKQTERCISDYVHAHERHFVFTFSQAVMFLLLYAGASAALLGVGGWLVVEGQLSIGQLVAAELIMSAVFLGLSRFSLYLKLYYELYGAAEKIGSALIIPQEEQQAMSTRRPDASSLVFDRLVLKHLDDHCTLDCQFAAGTKLYVTTDKAWVQKQLTAILKRYEKPHQGWLLLGDMSLYDYDTYELRQAITTIDRSLIMECTIADYLRLSAPDASAADIRRALEAVELLTTAEQLPDGLNTRLSALGTPLQPLELLLLKLAGAILSQPKLLLINQHFDAIPPALKLRLLTRIEQQPFTVLYFSNRVDESVFDGTLSLHDEAVLKQHSQTSREADSE